MNNKKDMEELEKLQKHVKLLKHLNKKKDLEHAEKKLKFLDSAFESEATSKVPHELRRRILKRKDKNA